MYTLTRQYDRDLAVATLVLNILLTATQIGYVADGLMTVSGQGWFLSLLFAVVTASGFLLSQFLLSRLRQKSLTRIYAWCLAALNAATISIMSVWGMTQLAEPWTARWYFGAFLAILIPLETMLLANMTVVLFSLTASVKVRGTAVIQPDRLSESMPLTALSPEVSLGAESSAQLETPEPELESEPPAEPVPAPQLAHEPAQELVLSKEPDTAPILTAQTGAATISFYEERVEVRLAAGGMSKRLWKDLHSELRRIGSIRWDGAEKSTSQEGGRLRLLTGRIVYPQSRGKKSKDKMENARLRHIEQLQQLLKSVIERY